MKKAIATAVSLSIVLAGCATASKDLAPVYVSPLTYQSYDCDQLSAETQRVQIRVQQLGGHLDEASNNDKAITAVGVILFWPILFALGGNKQQEAEYSRLKGEYNALQQQAIAKKCPTAVPPPASAVVAAPAAVPAAVPVAAEASATQEPTVAK